LWEWPGRASRHRVCELWAELIVSQLILFYRTQQHLNAPSVSRGWGEVGAVSGRASKRVDRRQHWKRQLLLLLLAALACRWRRLLLVRSKLMPGLPLSSSGAAQQHIAGLCRRMLLRVQVLHQRRLLLLLLLLLLLFKRLSGRLLVLLLVLRWMRYSQHRCCSSVAPQPAGVAVAA
jgi:hypothetical protein